SCKSLHTVHVILFEPVNHLVIAMSPIIFRDGTGFVLLMTIMLGAAHGDVIAPEVNQLVPPTILTTSNHMPTLADSLFHLEWQAHHPGPWLSQQLDAPGDGQQLFRLSCQ